MNLRRGSKYARGVGTRSDEQDLLRLVQRDPRAVAARAAALQRRDPSPRVGALAAWAVGLAHRELGELEQARRELERAWTSAMELDEHEMAGEIAVSLSLVVAYQGELGNALEILAVSEPGVSPPSRGRLRTQRGMILYEAGHFADALVEYEAALDLLIASEDALGEARLRTNIGALLAYLGRGDDARTHLRLADEQAAQLDQTLIQALAAQNLAYIDMLDGDFPSAFDHFERAAAHYHRTDYDGPLARGMRVDHTRALLQANLLDEARQSAEALLVETGAAESNLDHAAALLLAAEVRLATGDLPGAVAGAERSVAAFAALERRAWVALARAVLLRARAADRPDRNLVADLGRNADELIALGCRHDALRSRLLQAEVALGLGDVTGADELLRGTAGALRSNVMEQPAALRVRALVELAKGDRMRARRAVNVGMRLLAEQQATLGAVELRAHAAANSDGMATIGVRLAIADRRPRELLSHLEATRRTTSLLAVSRPPEDELLADLLAELRRVTSELREVELDLGRRAALDAEQLALERRIRNHVRRAPASGPLADLGLAECIARLGDRVLIEYANLDGTLLAVLVVDNRTTVLDLGPVDGLVRDIDACSHALHRLNRQQGSAASRASATATLGAIAAELADRLVPRRVLRSGRPVVVVPTGVLHALPWAALPGLTGRAVSVAPSFTGWAIATGRVEPTEHVTLVAGPALEHAEREVETLRTFHDGPTVLTGGDATADAVLAAIGKSDLAHLACHGSYRADNPLFSTLRLHDGPLTAYDLERCPAMPRTVVLSACNVAMGAPAGGGALLGLATSLMTFGAGSVIAPLTPVSDEHVVPVMGRLHGGLLAGLAPAQALAEASQAEDGLLDPTAAAFVVIGA